MASWMIHFRVADALLDRFPSLLGTEFVFGNIAPDSGVPDEDYTFIPPKSVSHFQKPHGEHKISGYDIYANEYLTPAKLVEYDLAVLSFHLGYFSHLLTDYLWALNIALPTFERDREEYLRDKDAAVRKYKVDWYDLDFRYLRDHPDFRAFRLYRDADEFKNIYLEFFPADAFELRREHIVSFYSETRENFDREYPWLTPERVDEFVNDTVGAIARELAKYL